MHGWINDRFVRRKAELPSILSILRILHIAKWNRMYYNDLCVNIYIHCGEFKTIIWG
jgi:hypothetical protein